MAVRKDPSFSACDAAVTSGKAMLDAIGPNLKETRSGNCDGNVILFRNARFLVQLHLPEPWHFRAVSLQLPGSASRPSGPMQVWVYMHQNRPSLQGGTVTSRSASMKRPFHRSPEHNCGWFVSKRWRSGRGIMPHLLVDGHANREPAGRQRQVRLA